MHTKSVNENRKSYERRSVLHICAGGHLFRAPAGTAARKGATVVLKSYEEDAQEAPVGAVVEVNGELESWLPWPEGKGAGAKKTERQVYTRRKVRHICGGKKRLFALPPAAKGDVVLLVDEPTDEEALVMAGGELHACPRWFEGEKRAS